MLELKLPELGENIETAEVSAVLVAIGDFVRRDQAVIEVETEKASLEVPATADGKVVELLVKAGDQLRVDQIILKLDADADAVAESTPEPVAPVEPPAMPQPAAAPVIAFPSVGRSQPVIGSTAPAAPSSRALAHQLGVDIGQVPGSGLGGRISRGT